MSNTDQPAEFSPAGFRDLKARVDKIEAYFKRIDPALLDEPRPRKEERLLRAWLDKRNREWWEEFGKVHHPFENLLTEHGVTLADAEEWMNSLPARHLPVTPPPSPTAAEETNLCGSCGHPNKEVYQACLCCQINHPL